MRSQWKCGAALVRCPDIAFCMCLLLTQHMLINILCVVCTVDYRREMAPEVVGAMFSQGFSDAEIDAAMSAPSSSGVLGVRAQLTSIE